MNTEVAMAVAGQMSAKPKVGTAEHGGIRGARDGKHAATMHFLRMQKHGDVPVVPSVWQAGEGANSYLLTTNIWRRVVCHKPTSQEFADAYVDKFIDSYRATLKNLVAEVKRR